MNKSILRKIYLEKRKNLSRREAAEKSMMIAARFFQYFDLSGVRFLHCFVPIEKLGEIDTYPIFDRLRREFPRVAPLAPRVDFASGAMESIRFASASELVRSRYGIDEPAGGAKIAAGKIDIVLTPLLCFDLRGHRVGYGKGFYDRFLRECRADCLKIGLSLFEPLEKIIDARDFDVKLDACVTPKNVYRFGA